VTLDLATIPGDGIGPEVVEQALRALRAADDAEGGEEVRVTEYPFGAGHYLATGHILDDAELAERDVCGPA
jgi:3-isopropylmalate dehydrogenase